MMISVPLLTFALALSPLEVDSAQSSIDGSFQQSIYMLGSLIGNWDAKANPEGTTTLPGYWGGSGNNVIGCNITPSLGGAYYSPCFGELDVEVDLVNDGMTITGLRIEAFEESPATFPVTLGLLYETFRTQQPSSLYIGDIPLEIPIGEGSLTMLKFQQELEVSTVLTIIDEQTWSYSADIPVTITFEAVVLDTSTGPIVSPGILQLSGTVEQTASQLTLTGTSTFKSNEVIESPPIAFDDIPFDVPTIIPAGEIAHLLLSAAAESATISNAVNIQIVASGNTLAPGDVDGDGWVGVTDLLAVIAAWGPCQDCMEDLNNDSVVDVSDLLEIIGNWSGS
jgi:hypothetical protein